MARLSFHIEESGNGRNNRDFYSEYFPHFLMFAMNYVDEEETCKDIVQDVFIKYWEIQSQFDDELSVKAFLYKSIRNGCLNLMRHHSIRNKYLSDVAQQKVSEDFFMDTVIKEEVSTIILKEIDKLSETSQKIIRQSIEGFSNEEIAANMDISINTVKTHKARSYIILRRNLAHLKVLLALLAS